MIHRLKPGDLVRIAPNKKVPGYLPGDTGTVQNGPILLPTGGPYYIVKMDKQVAETDLVIVTPDEVELVQ